MSVRDELESVIRKRLTGIVAVARERNGPALTETLNSAVTAILNYADAYAVAETTAASRADAAAAARAAVAGGDMMPGRRRRVHMPRPGDTSRTVCDSQPAGPEWVSVLPDKITCPRCRGSVAWADAVRRLAAAP